MSNEIDEAVLQALYDCNSIELRNSFLKLWRNLKFRLPIVSCQVKKRYTAIYYSDNPPKVLAYLDFQKQRVLFGIKQRDFRKLNVNIDTVNFPDCGGKNVGVELGSVKNLAEILEKVFDSESRNSAKEMRISHDVCSFEFEHQSRQEGAKKSRYSSYYERKSLVLSASCEVA